LSAFEFFFGFYGMVLGLSVAVIATGFATSIQHRKAIRIGWLTLLLALFVSLDIATFWDAAWHTFRDAPFSYGMLVIGLAIALVYFIAASLIFPHQIDRRHGSG
jgi:tetrahydromethanopterin S-methyltransferase subunit G